MLCLFLSYSLDLLWFLIALKLYLPFCSSLIINTQKFVGGGSHVAVIMFFFGTLFIKELIDRIIYRLILDQHKYDREQCSPQSRCTLLCNRIRLGIMLTGIFVFIVITEMCCDCTTTVKAASISDFCHKLRTSFISSTIKTHDSIVFRQQFCNVFHDAERQHFPRLRSKCLLLA